MKSALRALGAPAALSLIMTLPAAAQSPWLTTAALGTTPRVGSVPGAFHSRGSNWGGHFILGRRLSRRLFLSTSIGASMQNYEVDRHDSSGTTAGTFDFHSYTFSAGPSLVFKPLYGFIGVATAHPAVIVSFWGAATSDACLTLECYYLDTPVPASRQTETRLGAALSLLMAYQFRGPSPGGETPYALGFEIRGIAGPAHRHTGLPISQVGLYLALIAGAP